MVMPADYFKSELINANTLNAELAPLEVLALIKCMIPNIEKIIPADNSNKAYTTALQLAKKHTDRNKVLILQNPLAIEHELINLNDNDVEIIPTGDAALLCETIANSSERLAAVVIKDNHALPYYYKKVRELTSAEGAVMIWCDIDVPSISSNTKIKISKNSLPDIACINLIATISSTWIGGRSDLFSFSRFAGEGAEGG